jgi:hypothetical protein
VSGLLYTVIVVVVLAAAARSTWSPCALSMMSTITPFGERARGHRYGATASWFVVGSVIGGLTTGSVAAGIAVLLSTAGVAGHPAVIGLLAGAMALAGTAVDCGFFGPVLPVVRRQVDDGWVARYRPWVYGSGFGWQIGTGVFTYVMTAAIPVWVVLAALTGSPLAAAAAGGLFGLARGSTVLLTADARTPARLRTLHAAIDRIEQPVRVITASVLGASGGALVGASAGVALLDGGLATILVPSLLGGCVGVVAGLKTWTSRGACPVGSAGGPTDPAGRSTPQTLQSIPPDQVPWQLVRGAFEAGQGSPR